MTDELEGLTAKQQASIIKGLVLGILAIGSVAGTGVLRLDKYGRSDSEKDLVAHEAKMREWVELRIAQEVNSLEAQMPPNPTRERIYHLESCAKEVCQDYRPPTHNWR